VRVVICDSNRILREALAAALEICDDDVTAVAAGSVGDCIAAIVRDDAEVCVLDPHLPGAGDSVDVIRKIRSSCPAAAVVVISEPSAALTWTQAKELGVVGLLGKNRSVSEIAQMLGLHPSTLTGVLARLEERGLILREVDAEDRRRARFTLTAGGKKIDRERRGTVEAATRRALTRLDGAAVDALLAGMNVLVEELERDD